MKNYDVVVVGAGFTGLTAAYVLSNQGKSVHVVETDPSPGGLAGSFEFNDGVILEKYYHHWFNHDKFVTELVKELGKEDDIILRPARTGIYYNHRLWKLSTPFDLLSFKAISFIDRIRLGLLVYQVRRIKNWKEIEHLSIREWLEPICGKSVYRVVWEPLVKSKFSVYAEDISAVWMWKKLVLRGGTRNLKGGEELAYFKGGFGKLAETLSGAIQTGGGKVSYGTQATGVTIRAERVSSLITNEGEIHGNTFLFTPALPIIAGIFEDIARLDWLNRLKRVSYLGNMCLVLRLKQSLSSTYWLNVNDPGFPFVGVIEHTNFDSPKNYGNTSIVYLSRYLAVEDPVWSYSDKRYLEFSMLHLKRMFPQIENSWIVEYKVWRSEYAQPVSEKNYSRYIIPNETPYKNAWISTMAQIYPEDRGTNYAIREGRAVAENIAKYLEG